MSIRILSENYFNNFQFSGHTITASTQQTGNEAWRVGTGRRSARNYWTTASTGAKTIQVQCDQVRSADVLALDRGHNLSTVTVEFTNSTAAGWTTCRTITLPTATYPHTSISDGARMPDGSYICRFAASSAVPAAVNWRLTCTPTTGAPKVVGAYLGRSFSPAAEPLRPYAHGSVQMLRDEVASPEFWTAGSRVAYRHTGSASVRLTEAEGDSAQLWIENRYWKGELAWITPDERAAEQSVLVTAPSATRTLAYPTDWRHRVLALDWVEHQPKPR